jgi:hypothetical protein
MPFHEAFWKVNEVNFAKPQGLLGFFTMLPIYWTAEENNHPGEMNVMLLSQAKPYTTEINIG